MPDEQRAVREHLARLEPVRPDRACPNPGPHRPRDVVGNVVPDEQHLTGRALRGGDHQVVEQGIVLTY